MELVNLIYRYINRFINVDDLLVELKKIDLSKYTKEDNKEITSLILNVEEIKETIPNEKDEAELKRIADLDEIIKILEKALESDSFDDDEIEEFKRKYNQCMSEKELVKDGGKLYDKIFEILTNNNLINKYARRMDAEELLEFITEYIFVQNPPIINQDVFDELVDVGIKGDKRKKLWRLAFNYNLKNKDFTRIEDYFIEKRDAYYLIELIHAVEEDLDVNNIINKILATGDKDFMNVCADMALAGGLTTPDEVDEVIRVFKRDYENK